MALASWDDTNYGAGARGSEAPEGARHGRARHDSPRGIDNVIHASTGGLIVIGEPEEISFLFSGGLKLDVDYTPA